MRIAFDYSCPDAGSKNRIRVRADNLRKDVVHVNRDEQVETLLRRYVRPGHVKDLEGAIRYLRNLRSSFDGLPYSQGVKQWSKLEEAISRFKEPNHTWFGWNENYKKAKEKLLSDFAGARLHPLVYASNDDVYDALPKKDTHAGASYLETGKKEKGEYSEELFELYCLIEKAIMDGERVDRPMLPAYRTQASGAYDDVGMETGDCKHKTRLVLIVDLPIILLELRFAKPIQDWMAGKRWYAGGKDLATQVASIVSTMRMNHGHWVSLDFSSFDASISAWLIRDAFEIIRAAFPALIPDDEKLYMAMVDHFIEKDILISEDEVVHVRRGVPSGSMWTQIVDSVVNLLVINTYFFSKGIEGEEIVMGDDNLAFTDEKVDVKDLASYVGKNFGMSINPEKTIYGTSADNPHFLSREWWAEGQYREPHQTVARMLYPERRRIYDAKHGTPEMVFWAFCLLYPVSMWTWYDTDRFVQDNPGLTKGTLKSMRGSRNIPGSLRFLMDYTSGYWSM